MKFFIQIVLTALLAWLLQGLIHLPWWTVVIAGMASAIPQKLPAGRSFLAGFIGIFLLWSIVAFFANSSNGGLLSGQVGQLFSGATPMLMVLITGLIGGFVGGLGAMTGTLIEQGFGKKDKREFRN